jgi:hypothetical protein
MAVDEPDRGFGLGAVCGGGLLLVLCGAARAADPFEIQVYDGTADGPGEPGLELHVNDWLTGHRSSGTPPEAPLHGQFHLTFEPSVGVMPFWEVGAYLQFAVRTDDGVADWAGAKLRSKFVTPPGWDRHWRLGLNLEVSYLPFTYDANRWGTEVRPIAAWSDARWLFVVNPIFDQALASPGAAAGPEFDPAVKVARTFGPIALGFEYYGDMGPIRAPRAARDETHYIFEALDVVSIEAVELNFGVGEGLTPASAGILVKAIVGYTFENAPRRPPSPARPGGASRGDLARSW